MFHKIVRIGLVAFVVLGLVAGCGPAATPTSAVPTQTPRVIEGLVTPTPEPKPAPGSIALNGAGATFPWPIYTEWIFAYQYVDPSVTINYQGIGSGGGIKAIKDGTVDFAGSDSLLKEEDYAEKPDLQMLPILAGAVVPIYNLIGKDGEPIQDLILDIPTLVDIYMAKVTKWNDPKIAALNPDLRDKLPDAIITAVHRSDGSGTTEIFTTALAGVSDEWENSVGAGKAVEWPVDKAGNGIGGKGNPGVAAAVQNTPNSIGYVELSYAVSNNIPFAKMVNAAGNVVVANAETLQSAMSDFGTAFDERLTIKSISNGQGPYSWPICGYTYLIITMEQSDCAKAKALLNYIRWSLTDPGAAKRAADLGYATIPEAVRDLVLSKLQEVKCNGQPVLSSE
ncbi:MAG: phosphate ABC transporter substrate-binding protein PstS [Chloroflexi bacterium]|nr:phosphate ABC transporter substrate-binding protein PstS [Chloroflexota bacterium]